MYIYVTQLLILSTQVKQDRHGQT